jgi:hypothetical protein
MKIKNKNITTVAGTEMFLHQKYIFLFFSFLSTKKLEMVVLQLRATYLIKIWWGSIYQASSHIYTHTDEKLALFLGRELARLGKRVQKTISIREILQK